MRRRLPLFSALALLLACASLDPSSGVLRLDPAEHPPRPAEEVAVLDAFPSDRGYSALARLQVTDGGWEESRAKMIARLRDLAGPLGAEAIVVEETTTRRRSVMTFLGGGRFSERVLVGTAIV
jgi:hypothetical protein